MNETVKSVDYREALLIKVGKWLIKKGFGLAESTGVALESLEEENMLGIFSDVKPRKKFLSGLIKRWRPRREFLGKIYFNNSVRGTDEQNWVIEVHGQKNVSFFKQLAEEMISAFNVNVSVRLVREEPNVERFLEEFSL